MKLFAALKKVRTFERLRLPVLSSLTDFDILIEIGYAEEAGRPLTAKQVLLMDLGSRSTVRRKLSRLADRGIVRRLKNKDDQRSSLLSISPSSQKLLARYGSLIASVFASGQ